MNISVTFLSCSVFIFYFFDLGVGIEIGRVDRASIELHQSHSIANTEMTDPHKWAFQSFSSLLSHQYLTLQGDQSHQLQLSAPSKHRVNGVYCTSHHSPLCGVENILTGLYLWHSVVVLEWIMKKTKCILLDAHLYQVSVSCGGLRVWPM